MKHNLKWPVFLLALFLFGWGFYLKILSPTVNLKDSGELITSAFTLGIAHPPGYPLYSLPAHLFSRLPLGEIAFRVNAFSAFWGVLGLVFCAMIVLELGGGISGALAAVGLIGSAPVFLTTAIISEVYTLELTILLLAIYWLVRRKINHYWCVFSIAMFLALHPKNLVYCLPLIIFFFIGRPVKPRSIKRGINYLFLVLLLVGVYLYLPLRARNNPSLNWNRPVSFKSVVFHLSGKEYRGRIFKPSVKQVALFVKNFYPTFSAAFSWIGLLIGGGGLISLLYFGRFRLAGLFLGLFFVNLLFGVLALDPVEGFLPHFYLTALFVTALLCGLGVRGIPDLVYDVWTPLQGEPLVRQIVLLMVLASFIARFPRSSGEIPLPDRRRDYVAYDFAVNQLKCLLPRSALFAVGTRMTFPLKYALSALNKRPDVLLVEGGFLKPLYLDWYLPSLPVPSDVFQGQSDAPGLHHALIEHFLRQRPLNFAPLYSSRFSPLEARRLPKSGRFLNYGMGNWFLPTLNLSKGREFLRMAGRRFFTLRSYYQPAYQLTPYERYVFRKYNQFFRLTKQLPGDVKG